MAILRKLINSLTGGRGRRRTTTTRRTRRRGSASGGVIGAIKGFLRGSGRRV